MLRWTPSGAGSSSHSRRNAFCRRMAVGPAAQIMSTVCASSSSISPSGTSDSTRPQSLACSAPDRLAGVDDAGSTPPTHQARQQRRRDDGGDADHHLGHGELGGRVGHPEIARRRNSYPRPEAVSGNTRHHRDRRVAKRGAHTVQRGDEGARRLARQVDHDADVRPTDEGALARAAQDDGPDFRVLARLPDGGAQRVGASAVDGVELLRIVVAHGRDMAAAGTVLDLDMNLGQRSRSLGGSNVRARRRL